MKVLFDPMLIWYDQENLIPGKRMKVADQEYRILPSLHKTVLMLLLVQYFQGTIIRFLALLKTQQLIIDISLLKNKT